MAEIKGVDTIIPENCPKLGESVEVSQDIIVIGSKVQMAWWNIGMSFIPYCTQCAVPLIWHRPTDGDVLFSCPVCERKWVMDCAWIVQLQMRSK
jgi:predicted RNA-binding Zn-ribbon protein involved in translation (DUF1610 family)